MVEGSDPDKELLDKSSACRFGGKTGMRPRKRLELKFKSIKVAILSKDAGKTPPILLWDRFMSIMVEEEEFQNQSGSVSSMLVLDRSISVRNS